MSRWEPYPLPPKPFYRRTWFVSLALSLLVIGIVITFVALNELQKFERKAKTFDFTKLSDMESASVIYDRTGQVLGKIFIQNRDEVPVTELSENIMKAVVGAEDARYYQHHGVDYFGILRAFIINYKSGRTRQGASTITQQLARNTFPEELPSNDRSYSRKILETCVAREIENRCSKRDILGLYLNRVFFGSGFYGVEAASRGYFGKSANELSLSDACMLAGLLKSPNNLSPWRNRQACIEQRNYVLKRLLELKMITKAEYDTAFNQQIIVKNRRRTHQDSYASDFVAQQVKKLVGDDNAVSEGYKIYTTIDLTLQKAAEAALKEQLEKAERHEGFDHQTYAQFDQIIRAYRRRVASEGDAAGPQPEPEYLQGSVIALDNTTGGILALVGGRDFHHSEFDRAISARRPSGTAFAPIVYAAAFEKGLFPGTILQDAVMDNRQVMIGGTTGILGEWGPERADNRYEGAISARTALVKSKNAATVRMGNLTGMTALNTLSKAAGIESPLRKYPSTYLGASEVTLLEMALANISFPNGGIRPKLPFIIDRIEEKGGKVLFRSKTEKVRSMKPTTAFEVHSCLADVLEFGTADRTFSELGVKREPLGGKTGTAYNFTDVWFIGYSSEITVGVWAGFDKPRTPIYRGAFSNEIALPVWADVMKASFATFKPKEIVQPKGIIKVELCTASGLLATNKCFESVDNKETGESMQHSTTYSEICTDAQAPKDGCDVHGPPNPAKMLAVANGSASGGGNWPRGVAVSDPNAHEAVVMKASTVLGEDPYNSAQSVSNALNMNKMMGKQAPIDNSPHALEAGTTPEVTVRPAQPVGPLEQSKDNDPVVQLDQPPPLNF